MRRCVFLRSYLMSYKAFAELMYVLMGFHRGLCEVFLHSNSGVSAVKLSTTKISPRKFPRRFVSTSESTPDTSDTGSEREIWRSPK